MALYTNRLPNKAVYNKALNTAVKNLQKEFKNVMAGVSTIKR